MGADGRARPVASVRMRTSVERAKPAGQHDTGDFLKPNETVFKMCRFLSPPRGAEAAGWTSAQRQPGADPLVICGKYVWFNQVTLQ